MAGALTLSSNDFLKPISSVDPTGGRLKMLYLLTWDASLLLLLLLLKDISTPPILKVGADAPTDTPPVTPPVIPPLIGAVVTPAIGVVVTPWEAVGNPLGTPPKEAVGKPLGATPEEAGE